MDKLEMFQSRSGKIDKLGCWDLERISVNAGTIFTSTEFKEECQTRGVHFTLVAPEHQETNRQIEMTWRTLRKIVHSLMVHARVSEACIHFSLMYDKPYFPGSTNQRSDKQKWRSDHTI